MLSTARTTLNRPSTLRASLTPRWMLSALLDVLPLFSTSTVSTTIRRSFSTLFKSTSLTASTTLSLTSLTLDVTSPLITFEPQLPIAEHSELVVEFVGSCEPTEAVEPS